jgi:multidrug resistance efflux pump
VRVKVGDRVRAGQLLAALDVAEASAQAAATAAGVRAAQVGYDMAKDAEKRTLALFEQHAVSDAENLAAQNRAALALAQLEQARAQARLASVGLGNGSLSAPFSGLVTRVPSGVGKIVGPGEPLFHLEDTSLLKLTATLSEADARLVEVGAVVALSDGAASGALEGKVTAVLVTSAKEVPVLELPPGALRPGSQDEVVTLAGGRAHLVPVAFTQGEGGALLVRSGLAAADAVVLNPSAEVREGDDLSGTN